MRSRRTPFEPTDEHAEQAGGDVCRDQIDCPKDIFPGRGSLGWMSTSPKTRHIYIHTYINTYTKWNGVSVRVWISANIWKLIRAWRYGWAFIAPSVEMCNTFLLSTPASRMYAHGVILQFTRSTIFSLFKCYAAHRSDLILKMFVSLRYGLETIYIILAWPLWIPSRGPQRFSPLGTIQRVNFSAVSTAKPGETRRKWKLKAVCTRRYVNLPQI